VGCSRRITVPLVALAALTLGCVASVAACKGKAPTPRPVGVVPAASSSPPDRLGPGEAPPGRIVAFDLVLPVGSRITARFTETVYAVVPLSLEETATWVRKLAPTAVPIMGAAGTSFDRVVVPGAAAGHHLYVSVRGSGSVASSEVIVDYVEDKPISTAPRPVESVMRDVGLSPDGKMLDPSSRKTVIP
jgi:hypothetical protein